MTTALRIEHRGGTRHIQITEESKNEHGLSAVIATLRHLGEVQEVHVHADNKFVIEEIDPAQQHMEG